MRVATWNVNSVGARLPRLLDWLATAAPDVVCLQETKCADDAFPQAEVAELGYAAAVHGSGRWNGVAVLSRLGLADVEPGFAGAPGFPAGTPPEARAITATCGPLRVTSVYVPNGRTPEDPHYAYKLAWLAALTGAVGIDVTGERPYVVCGDFNVAPTDDDVFDPAAFVGSTHVTGPERAALVALGRTGLHDVLPRPLKYDRPFTYWDYRAGAFHKNLGMRIDLVLADDAARTAVRDAYVDREARKGSSPSDHAPVVVDLQW
ncbi:MAG: exodeoxyribonuclease III [Geodermatophilaceae bacterium]|nr:exodeoxyribonuclease III [Geodermatophilaceae bacterium]